MRSLLHERAFFRRGGGRRGIRGGGGGPRGIPIGPDPEAWGLSSFDSSTALATASSAGIAGSAVNGVSALVLWSVAQVPPVGTQILFLRLSGNNGWNMQVVSAAVQMRCGNGSALATSPTRTIVAGDVGKLHVTALSNDTTAIYHYHDSAQVGTSTALAGFSPATQRTVMGSTATGTGPAVDFTIYDVMGRDSHLSLADFQTICTATKAANNGRFALGGVTMAHRWSAPTSAVVPSTVSDVIGSDNMSFILGTEANLVSAAMSPIVWGF